MGLGEVHCVGMFRVDYNFVDAVIQAAGHTRKTYEGPFPFPDGTTEIGQGAFYNCKRLKEARIPETVTKIESNAFTLCESLEVVTLSPNLKVLSESVFARCSSLGAIVVPEGVEEIEDTAFGYCTGLKGINFLGTPKIEWYAFKGTHADFIVLRNSLLFDNKSYYTDDPRMPVHSFKKMLNSAKIIIYAEESRWYWKLVFPYDEKIEIPAMTKVLMDKSASRFLGPSMSRSAINRALAKDPFLLPPLPSTEKTNPKWLDLSRKLFPQLPDEIRLMIIEFITGNVTAGLTELLKTFDVSRAITSSGVLYDHTV